MAAVKVQGTVTYLSSKYEFYFTWEETNINTAANTSDVTVKVYARRTASGYESTTGAGTSRVQIDGVNSSLLTGVTVNLQTNTNAQLLQTYTRTITHLADGSKSLTIKAGEAVAGGAGIIGVNNSSFSPYKGSAQGSITLTTIPREASITNASIDFVIGASIPLTISNPANYWVKAETYVNNVLIKTQNLGQVTTATLTFNSTEAGVMYAQVPNALSISTNTKVRLKTYSDSGYVTQFGSDSDKTCIASVDPATNAPTFTLSTTPKVENIDKTVSVTDKYGNVVASTSTETLIGGSSHKNIGIQYLSKIRATIATANKMVPKNSATAAKYRYTNGSQYAEVTEGAGDKTVDVNNILSAVHSVAAIDSRGLSTTLLPTLSVYSAWSYIDAFAASTARANNIDEAVTLTFYASYWKKYFSSNTTSNPGYGVLNTITMAYRYKETAKTWNTSDGTITVTIASPGVVTKSSHGLATGDQIYFTTTGALPTGLTASTYYYIIKIDANTFWLASSYANAIAGTKVNTSGSQSGVHTMWHCGMWTTITPTSDTSGAVTFSNTINGDLGSTGFNVNKGFDVEVRVYDKLSVEIIETKINVGTPLAHWYREGANWGVSFGAKYSTAFGGILQATGNAYITGDIKTYGISIKDTFKTGWMELITPSWTYASASTITVPTNAQTDYGAGFFKIRFKQGGAYKYAYAKATAATTVTVYGGTDFTVANAAITDIAISYEEGPIDFPQWFNYAGNWHSSGTAPSLGNGTLVSRFTLRGNTVLIKIKLVMGSTTTFGTGNYMFDIPIASAALTGTTDSFGLAGYSENLGVAAYSVLSARMASSTDFTVQMTSGSAYYTLGATSPFTWDDNDYFNGVGFYEVT